MTVVDLSVNGDLGLINLRAVGGFRCTLAPGNWSGCVGGGWEGGHTATLWAGGIASHTTMGMAMLIVRWRDGVMVVNLCDGLEGASPVLHPGPLPLLGPSTFLDQTLDSPGAWKAAG